VLDHHFPIHSDGLFDRLRRLAAKAVHYFLHGREVALIDSERNARIANRFNAFIDRTTALG